MVLLHVTWSGEKWCFKKAFVAASKGLDSDIKGTRAVIVPFQKAVFEIFPT